MDDIKQKLDEFFEKLCVPVTCEVVLARGAEALQIRVATTYSDDARLLIGECGQNLAALEHIIRRMLYKDTVAPPVAFVDVNGYRAHQIEILKDEARDYAKRVRLYHKEVRLRPMSSFERRVVHLSLSECPDLVTESIGDDPRRMVVIKPYP